jgi:hypothetical protein
VAERADEIAGAEGGLAEPQLRGAPRVFALCSMLGRGG